MSVFKSYLRRLLQSLKDIDGKLPDIEETKEAKEILRKLIEDTQSGLEDS